MNTKPISLDQPLARGRTADAFEWDDGHILKLFHNWFPLEDIEYEMKIARAVYDSGVKSPAVHELVQVQGRNGLVYERVRGESMLAMFQRKPWLAFTYARTFARLHAQMHECVIDADVPKQHRRLQSKIRDANALPVLVKASLLRSLEEMPDGDRVCHGDFHPANVLLSESDSTIIDWIDASRGNPAADVARTSIILLGALANKQIRNPLMRIFIRFFHRTYLREYTRLHGLDEFEYRRWLPIVAGARLSENIPELEKWLVQQAKRKP
ncbi:MAG: phosphotransferase [Anaerolineales bacterium]|nr:phosphotransferase [Anaerolineales bacterium]